jgi:hypothetical protein
MSDELKPQSIRTLEFANLMNAWRNADILKAPAAYDALIAHIDAWGARLAESKVVGREHLNRFIDGYCLGRSDLIACTEAAFFYFNKVASGQADNEASA